MRLILAHQIDPEEIDRILSDFGLEFSGSQEKPGQAYSEVWMPLDLDDEAVVHYVDDRPIGVRYFIVNGEESWVQRVRQSFPIMTEQEVLDQARVAGSDDERILATYMIALIAPPEPREPHFAELKASLLHPSQEVRCAAIIATGYTTWPALEDILVELSTTDESPRVRERAERMLQQIAKYGWVEPDTLY